MDNTQKLRFLTFLQKVVSAVMVMVWLYIIYVFATSGMPMIRQMVGCMLSTMVVFALLSFSGKLLARHRERLQSDQG